MKWSEYLIITRYFCNKFYCVFEAFFFLLSITLCYGKFYSFPNFLFFLREDFFPCSCCFFSLYYFHFDFICMQYQVLIDVILLLLHITFGMHKVFHYDVLLSFTGFFFHSVSTLCVHNANKLILSFRMVWKNETL